MSKIIIGADFYSTVSNYSLFSNGETRRLFGRELEKLLAESSFRIFNLEGPLTDSSSPIEKCGPAFIAPVSAVNTYRKLNIDLLTLANNHIMDQDAKGLNSTIAVLNKNGIKHIGAGSDLSEAARPFIFEFCGKKVGIYACAEHEFSIAGKQSPGANPFDPLYSLDHVSELKSRTDFVIVLYHGGKEHYRYPSPRLQTVCRRLIDKGSNLVICQHSHCIGCCEEYKGGTVVYGQGNFLLDSSNSEYRQTSLLVSIDDSFKIDFIPIVKKGAGVRLADKEKGEDILQEFRKRSEQIENQSFVEAEYSKFADEVTENYLYTLNGKHSVPFLVMNKISRNMLRRVMINKKYKKKQLLMVRNYVECEAYNELMILGIKNRIKKSK